MDAIAFVFVLVSLLRIFVAEAYEIPSGSMAPTLLGFYKPVLCPECGYYSVVDARAEAEGRVRTAKAMCQNCQFTVDLSRITKASSGDRILVAKSLYGTLLSPQRWDVFVFKCPDLGHSFENYIKRLVGLPGETVRILTGDIWVAPPGTDQFQIARKPPAVMLATRRLVDDHDRPARDLLAQGCKSRWSHPPEWKHHADRSFTIESTDQGWLDFSYLVRDLNNTPPVAPPQPWLVMDFECYNSERGSPSDVFDMLNWVGDLMVEGKITLESLDSSGGPAELTLQLHEGAAVYQAALDARSGKVILQRSTLGKPATKLAEAITNCKGVGTHTFRFANFDDRLAFWIDDREVFPHGVDVPTVPQHEIGPTVEDLKPVRIRAQGLTARLAQLKVFRDIYYTRFLDPQKVADFYHGGMAAGAPGNLERWRDMLRTAMPVDYTIPEKAYFVCGDNSPQSADSRAWHDGLKFVPQSMVLGRALFLYWPPWPWVHWKLIR